MTAAEWAAITHAERCRDGWVTESAQMQRVRLPCVLCAAGRTIIRSVSGQKPGKNEVAALWAGRLYLGAM